MLIAVSEAYGTGVPPTWEWPRSPVTLKNPSFAPPAPGALLSLFTPLIESRRPGYIHYKVTKRKSEQPLKAGGPQKQRLPIAVTQ